MKNKIRDMPITSVWNFSLPLGVCRDLITRHVQRSFRFPISALFGYTSQWTFSGEGELDIDSMSSPVDDTDSLREQIAIDSKSQ